MRGLNKRLAAVEQSQPHNLPRLVCIKATMGRDTDTAALLSAAGLAANANDTLVLIRKPAGTGGANRVLFVKGEAQQ